MEQARRDTPNEKRKDKSPLAYSPWRRGTPLKRNDVHLKCLTYQNSAQCLPFTVVSNHITPPSKLRKFITKNPFEPDLINRLHLSAISPTVFAKVPSPMQQSPGFAWSIDELAHINPAKIEESPVQQMYSPDLEMETKAQAAIDRFFKQNEIIPSPWDVKQKEVKPFLPLDTPNRLSSDVNSNQELSKSTKDAWSQTILSLPLDLPPNVEQVLTPFFTFTQEQNVDNDDVGNVDSNSSNNSLRRKLFFCHDDGINNDDESFMSLSPVKMNESTTLSCSPPQSGMFAVHGTPLKRLTKQIPTRRHSNGSSVVISENFSPPNMSPIRDAEDDRLYKRLGRCSSTASLNFTIDMSTDDIVERKNQNSVNDYYPLDMSNNESNVKRTEDNGKFIVINNDKTNACDFVNMEELPKCINSIDNIMHSNAVVFSDKEHNNEISLKIPLEMSFSCESHKQSNIISGAFEQRNISNSIQDTGYQTHSMNSTLHTIDNTSINHATYNTSMNHKIFWNEEIVMSKDNAQLSWRENMRNVFSSTPSKYNKKK